MYNIEGRKSMVKSRLVPIAILVILLISTTVVAMPVKVGDRHTTGPIEPLKEMSIEEDSGQMDSEPQSLAAPGITWTDGPLKDKITKTLDNATWDRKNITVSGNKVGGDVTVKVTGVRERGNMIVKILNNQIGGNLKVEIDNNPFLYDLHVTVMNNLVGGDIYISTSSNAVSNLYFKVLENQACMNFDVDVNYNSIDYDMFVNVDLNKADINMEININGNYRPWSILFYTLTIMIKDNHIVKRNLKIYIIGNKMLVTPPPTPHMTVVIKNNGAGRDIDILILSNEAKPGIIDITIQNNEADNFINITVQGNKAFVINIVVEHNYCCILVPRVSIQGGINNDNVRKCMQSTGGDADHDGLSDCYEGMVGTDPSVKDTDKDGLLDGWDDKNHNMAYDVGEKYGEIGDPAGRYFHGGIRHLVAKPQHDPKPFCADIYVEVDFLTGQKNLPAGAVTVLEGEFNKHRIKLHIDNGWSKGGSGGGQRMNHHCENRAGKKYLFFYQSHPLHHLPGSKNDFYDFKEDSNYFDPDREDIFHYNIIAHYISRKEGGSMAYKDKVSGIAEKPGDDFVLAGKVISKWVKDKYGAADKKNLTLTLAKSFMHELGHNLDLADTYNAADKTQTVMYGYRSTLKPLDYKVSEWAALRPDKITNTTD